MTALQRPLVVVNDLFQDSILDLSWNTENHILLACSTDGTVACLQFAPEELGAPLSQENKVLSLRYLFVKKSQSFSDIFRVILKNTYQNLSIDTTSI